jgi:hypothetical protein
MLGVYLSERPRETKVAFEFLRSSALESATGAIVSYDKALLNRGDGMTVNGTFKAPVSGVYFFSFNFHERNVEESQVYFRLDGTPVARMFVKSTDADYGTHGQQVLIEVAEGREVDVYLAKGGMWASATSDVRFLGFLLYEV